MARIVEVVPYNSKWPLRYQKEARRICRALGEELIAIHPMGSTAVPGLAAKPIIDILIVVRVIEHLDTQAGKLLKLGYEGKGEFGIPGRRFFVLSKGDTRIFHLHSYQQGHPEIARHLNFVAYLRAHPDTARAYAELKLALAVKFRANPDAYTQAKTDFIRSTDRLAQAWRGQQAAED